MHAICFLNESFCRKWKLCLIKNHPSCCSKPIWCFFLFFFKNFQFSKMQHAWKTCSQNSIILHPKPFKDTLIFCCYSFTISYLLLRLDHWVGELNSITGSMNQFLCAGCFQLTRLWNSQIKLKKVMNWTDSFTSSTYWLNDPFVVICKLTVHWRERLKIIH